MKTNVHSFFTKKPSNCPQGIDENQEYCSNLRRQGSYNIRSVLSVTWNLVQCNDDEVRFLSSKFWLHALMLWNIRELCNKWFYDSCNQLFWESLTALGFFFSYTTLLSSTLSWWTFFMMWQRKKDKTAML